jgi:YidC/Oxa1 family membrane protein insertase
MMKLYREKGINPLASCLPLVLQFPVLISLFYMLRADLKKHICGSSLVTHYNTLHHSAVASVGKLPSKFIEQTSCNSVAPHSAKFLFVPDITTKATGAVLVVLILLYVGSQITSTLLMSSAAEPSQRWLMLGLPLFFVVILLRYPAGLLIYWITTNLLSMVQGYFVRRTMGPPPAVSKSAASPTPALAGVGAVAAPPPPPRKKKKRSGRRR